MQKIIALTAICMVLCGFETAPTPIIPVDASPVTKEDSKKEDQLITIRLEDNGTNFTAGIISLEKAAETIGLDKMKIKGVVTKEPNPGDNLTKYTITWGIAALDDNTTQIDKPFVSMLMADGTLEKDTSFNAKGDIDGLLEAFRRLQAKKVEEKDKNKATSTESTLANITSSAAAPANTSSPSKNPDIAPMTPNIAVTKDPFIFVTSEGCEIKVDPAQGVAIMQQRVLTDGKETTPCGDSLTKYPLTNVYSGCPVYEDTGKLTASEQATLGYTDPKTSGRVEVRGCTPDPDKSMFMIEKTEGCPDAIGQGSVTSQSKLVYNYKGVDKIMRDCKPTADSYPITKIIDSCMIRDDLEAGKSYQQKKDAYTKAGQVIVVPGALCQDDITISYNHIKVIDSCTIRNDFTAGKSYQQKHAAYVKDGKTVIIASSPCQDDTTAPYDQVSTRDTCTPAINGSTVIFSSRKYINVAGNRNYVSECTPETSAVQIQAETCASPKYTNDFASGQSYLNKNYFYMDGTNRVDVASCIKSEQTFTHFKDIAGCTATNDDTSETTQVYAKVFITADNKPTGTDRTYLTNCQPEGSPVAYSNNGYKWQVTGAQTSSINVSQVPITAYVSGSPYPVSPLLTSYGWTKQVLWSGSYYWDCASNNIYCIMVNSQTTPKITANGEYCLRSQLNTPWVTTENYIIDNNNSDTSPTWDFTPDTKTWMKTESTFSDAQLNPPSPPTARTWHIAPGSYNCTIPSCTVSKLDKYNSYTRGDGSTYVDTGTSIETKRVCGNGSKLLN